MAGTRVGEVGELVENILTFLPMKDILFAQQVSRFWFHIINGSKELQQLLFMRPIEETTSWSLTLNPGERGVPYLEGYDRVTVTNQSTLKASVVGPITEDPNWLCGERIPSQADLVRLNPLFFGHSTTTSDQDLDIQDRLEFGESRTLSFPASLSLPEDSKASYKRMYITQPPCREAIVELKVVLKERYEPDEETRMEWFMAPPEELYVWQAAAARSANSIYVFDERGVTMGQIMRESADDPLMRAARRHIKVSCVEHVLLRGVIEPSAEDDELAERQIREANR